MRLPNEADRFDAGECMMAEHPALDPVEVAHAALSVFPRELAVIMTAIAGAESGFIATAGGDAPATLRAIGGDWRAAATYNCPPGDDWGAASWGLWQIFAPYHHRALHEKYGAPLDPCELAEWLKKPRNNALAARHVYDLSGLSAWSMFRNGGYRIHLDTAERAVNEAIKNRQTTNLNLVIGFMLSLFGIYILNQIEEGNKRGE